MSQPGTGGGRLFRPEEVREYYFVEGCHILETLNDPADPAVSIVRARVEPGVTTRWHRLRGTWERYVILSGTGEAWVEQERFAVRPGDVLLIPPMAAQRIRNSGAGDLLFLAVCSPRFRREAYLEL